MTVVLILGSAPMAIAARDWPRQPFSSIVAINNAWSIRDDWDHMVHPWDYPEDRRPAPVQGQRVVTEDDFVPAQNAFGGFVYAGATMAFTAAYWVLHALRPKVIAVYGCDMHYPATGNTHFYGTGTPDPLRADITLQSLEAKSARLMILAAKRGCAIVNLSSGPSRLVFPRATLATVASSQPLVFSDTEIRAVSGRESELGYEVPSGRYWEELDRFNPAALADLDRMWLAAAQQPAPAIA